MTEKQLNRANHLFYGIDQLTDVEEKIWKLFEGDHEEEFKQIQKALSVVKDKFTEEFDSMKCD